MICAPRSLCRGNQVGSEIRSEACSRLESREILLQRWRGLGAQGVVEGHLWWGKARMYRYLRKGASVPETHVAPQERMND